MVSLLPLQAPDSAMTIQPCAPFQIFCLLVFLSSGNWARSPRHISWKSIETLVQVISALSALNFMQEHPTLGRCNAFSLPCFPSLCNIHRRAHLGQKQGWAWDANKKRGRRSKLMPSGLKWIKEKICLLASFLCVYPITKPHRCQCSWGTGWCFELMHHHRPWQASRVLSPFKSFQPLLSIHQTATLSCLLSKVLPIAEAESGM